jgi:RimJ/RimL family protein N-acetyltransferase
VIETIRLKLTPVTVALARAEISDLGEFARLLGAMVPDNGPPETLADVLPLFLGWLEAAPDRVGWFGWYALAAGVGAAGPVLVASGGFKGPPQDGTAELGYSVLPQFQGRGYATEMVVAETEWANPASVRVLNKAGFAHAGPATEPGGARFEFSGGA